jgi:hypothetical protein
VILLLPTCKPRQFCARVFFKKYLKSFSPYWRKNYHDMLRSLLIANFSNVSRALLARTPYIALVYSLHLLHHWVNNAFTSALIKVKRRELWFSCKLRFPHIMYQLPASNAKYLLYPEGKYWHVSARIQYQINRTKLTVNFEFITEESRKNISVVVISTSPL